MNRLGNIEDDTTSRATPLDARAHRDTMRYLSDAERTRRRLRSRAHRRDVAVVVVFCALFLSLAAEIQRSLSNYAVFRDQARTREARLAALQSRYTTERARLSFLQLDKGRAQVLVQDGYVRPGDRLLLFPSDETAAAKSSVGARPAASSMTAEQARLQSLEEKTVEPPSSGVSSRPSSSRRGISETVSSWWSALRAASGGAPTDSPSESKPQPEPSKLPAR